MTGIRPIDYFNFAVDTYEDMNRAAIAELKDPDLKRLLTLDLTLHLRQEKEVFREVSRVHEKISKIKSIRNSYYERAKSSVLTYFSASSSRDDEDLIWILNKLSYSAFTRNLPRTDKNIVEIASEQQEIVGKDNSEVGENPAEDLHFERRFEEYMSFLFKNNNPNKPKEVINKPSASFFSPSSRGGKRYDNMKLVMSSKNEVLSREAHQILEKFGFSDNLPYQERPLSDYEWYKSGDYFQRVFVSSISSLTKTRELSADSEGFPVFGSQFVSFRGAVIQEVSGKVRTVSVGETVHNNVLSYCGSALRHFLQRDPTLHEGYQVKTDMADLFERINRDELKRGVSPFGTQAMYVSDFKSATEFFGKRYITFISDLFQEFGKKNKIPILRCIGRAMKLLGRNYQIFYKGQFAGRAHKSTVHGCSGSLMGLPMTKELLHLTVALGLFDSSNLGRYRCSLILGDDVFTMALFELERIARFSGLKLNADKLESGKIVKINERCVFYDETKRKIVTSSLPAPKIFNLVAKCTIGFKPQLKILSNLAACYYLLNQYKTGSRENIFLFERTFMFRLRIESSFFGAFLRSDGMALNSIPERLGGVAYNTDSDFLRYLTERYKAALGMFYKVVNNVLVFQVQEEVFKRLPPGWRALDEIVTWDLEHPHLLLRKADDRTIDGLNCKEEVASVMQGVVSSERPFLVIPSSELVRIIGGLYRGDSAHQGTYVRFAPKSRLTRDENSEKELKDLIERGMSTSGSVLYKAYVRDRKLFYSTLV